jgi:hypothetical protein
MSNSKTIYTNILQTAAICAAVGIVGSAPIVGLALLGPKTVPSRYDTSGRDNHVDLKQKLNINHKRR